MTHFEAVKQTHWYIQTETGVALFAARVNSASPVSKSPLPYILTFKIHFSGVLAFI